jgi:peptidoglycan/LPS O-acetylase OafA/YrhL
VPRRSGARPHFRPDIEGLRAVAVLAVLFFHVGLPGFSGGFVGVDVFYVISGFLITGLLLREGQASGKVDLLRFYARRMRRLLPAALVVIVVTLAMSAAVLSPLRLTEVAGDATASALYVANFRFAIQAADYLSLDAPSPLLHFWTLGVEEQFYLVWPLLLLLVARFLSPRALAPVLVLLTIGSFGLSLYWTDANQAWAFVSPFTRAWELAAGALLAVGLVRLPHRTPRWLDGIVVVVGLGLVIGSIPLISTDTPFPGVAAVLPVLGAVLIILGGQRASTLPSRLLGIAPARYLGRISYSLYLWHWPLLILIPIAMGVDDLGIRLALAGVAIVVAAISTEVIEQPFRKATFLQRRTGMSLQLGLTTSIAVGVAGLLISGSITIPMPWQRETDPVVVELAGVREDLPRNYADGCHLDFEPTKPVDCVYGDPDGSRTAILFGDSHAAQWLPALDAYARSRGWRLESHTKSSCSPVLLDFWERKLRREYRECFRWRRAVEERVAELQPTIVFVGSTRDYEIWQDGRPIRVRDIYPTWQQGLTDSLQALAQSAQRVVLLAETPYLTYDPVDCLSDPRISTCDPPADLVIDEGYVALESAAAAAADADVLSVNRLLCPGRTCPVVVDGTVVFRDTNHVTASFMEELSRPIADLIEGRDPLASPSISPILLEASTN